MADNDAAQPDSDASADAEEKAAEETLKTLEEEAAAKMTDAADLDEAGDEPSDDPCDAPSDDPASDAAGDEGLPDNLDDALVALAAANTAAEGARDKSLRAVAEMENLRRRSSRDVENAHKFALEKFVKALVPVVESMERAETALTEQQDEATDTKEAAETAADGGDAVLEGVGLSVKLFKDTLEKQGVTQLDPHGEPFNPEHHEAIAMVPMPAMEPNSVIEVMRKGYLLNGRLIQAAQVVVSQAPPDEKAK